MPILFRGETTDHARKRGRVLRWFRDQVLRRMYKRCARLLYIGQRSYQHFRRLGVPEEKLVFSPYGVDTAPFQWDETSRAQLRPVARQRLGLTQSRKVLLFSGKLSERKDTDLILEAIRGLPRQVRSEIAVLWMGDGEERRFLEEHLTSVSGRVPYRIEQAILRRVPTDALVVYRTNRYSVPWGCVGQEVILRECGERLRFYSDGVEIADHPLLGGGRYQTHAVPAHYEGIQSLPHRANPAERQPSVSLWQEQAEEVEVRDLALYEALVAEGGAR